MSNPTRRSFLKGLGATLATVGVTAGSAAATSAAAAQPAHVVGIAAQQTGATATRSIRMNVRPDQLETLVVEQVRHLVGGSRQFTAYDVTRMLRSAHPNVNILHQTVRAIVHQQMQPVVASQAYCQRTLHFHSGSAIHYLPL